MKIKKNKIIDFIYYIYQNIDARIAGSEEEKLTAKYIKSSFENYSDKTETESFFCNPRSVQHEFNFISIIYLLGLISYLMYPPATLFFVFLYVLNVVLVMFYDIKIIDFIYSKSKSQNVISIIKPFNEVKHRIIFTSHIDSPYINKMYDAKFKEYLEAFNWFFPALYIVLFIITIIKITQSDNFLIDYMYLIPFLSIVAVIYFQNKYVTYEKSFGANNGLSGVAINFESAKHFFINRTNHTEIMFINFGAKEAGFAGSKNYLHKNFQLLKDSYIVNVDSVAGGHVYILENEKNIKHDNELIKIILEAASAENIKLDKGKSNIITTDASVFSYEKMRSVSFLSYDKYGIPLRYSLKEDLPQYIFEDDLENVFKICVKFVELIDER